MKKRVLFICLVSAMFIGIPLAAMGAPDAIHIGATVSQTGHFSSEIGPFKRLMNAWADLVNEKGGIMVKEYGKKLPVKFTIYDDRSDQATVKKYYERLATVDKVNLMLGPYSSPLTLRPVQRVRTTRYLLLPSVPIHPKSTPAVSTGLWALSIWDPATPTVTGK